MVYGLKNALKKKVLIFTNTAKALITVRNNQPTKTRFINHQIAPEKSGAVFLLELSNILELHFYDRLLRFLTIVVILKIDKIENITVRKYF